MPTVNTVSGPVDTADLGFTPMHEHIVVESPGVRENFPIFEREAEIVKAAAKLFSGQQRETLGTLSGIYLYGGLFYNTDIGQTTQYGIATTPNSELTSATGLYIHPSGVAPSIYPPPREQVRWRLNTWHLKNRRINATFCIRAIRLETNSSSTPLSMVVSSVFLHVTSARGKSMTPQRHLFPRLTYSSEKSISALEVSGRNCP